MAAEINVVRAAIENAEREIALEPAVEPNQDQVIIPNPFFAYREQAAL